jgi:hypothetical protein
MIADGQRGSIKEKAIFAMLSRVSKVYFPGITFQNISTKTDRQAPKRKLFPWRP